MLWCRCARQVQYGGRVTDTQDRKVLKEYTSRWLCAEACDSKFSYNPGPDLPATSAGGGREYKYMVRVHVHVHVHGHVRVRVRVHRGGGGARGGMEHWKQLAPCAPSFV